MVSCGGSNNLVIIISGPTPLTPGQSASYFANTLVTWTASGDGVISSGSTALSSTCIFTAGSAVNQTATITATAPDGSSGSFTLSVVAAGTNGTIGSGVASGLKHKAFVANSFLNSLGTGALNIVDADRDQLSNSVISIGGTPALMTQSSGGVIVFDSANNRLNLVDNGTEAITGQVLLPEPTSSVLSSVPGLAVTGVGYAAVPTACEGLDNCTTGGAQILGAVYQVLFNFSSPLSPATALPVGSGVAVPVPGATTLAGAVIPGVSGLNILAFSQNCDVVDLLQSTVVNSMSQLTNIGPIAGTSGLDCTPTHTDDVSGNFSRPITAVFTSNGSTGYVLSTGKTSSQALVTQVDFTGVATFQGKVSVRGAQVGLLQGTTLYVAGEDTNALGHGVLSIIDVSTNLGTTTPTIVTLGQGIPKVITCETTDTLGTCPAGARIWIGSTGCTLGASVQNGCLAVYTPGTGSVAYNQVSSQLSITSDDVTGMAWLKPLNGRQVMYVIEGGELQIYQAGSNPLTPLAPVGANPPLVDIVGQAVDVKLAF